MIVGCLKEIKKHEYRVGLTPDNVREYIAHGHAVMIEKDAGAGSSFTNEEYAAAAAMVVDSAADVWAKAEMIVKVKEPLEQEYSLMHKGQILYTYLHLAADKKLTEAVLSFAKENGFEQLNLEVRSDNARAIRLYEKYGFRKLCTFSHFFKINGDSLLNSGL